MMLPLKYSNMNIVKSKHFRKTFVIFCCYLSISLCVVIAQICWILLKANTNICSCSPFPSRDISDFSGDFPQGMTSHLGAG